VSDRPPDPSDPIGWLEAERDRPGGSRVEFRDQLRDIDRLLVDAAAGVATRICPTTAAFLEADSHRAAETAAASDEVRGRCLRLEDACYVILARQSPVGADLRHVVAVLRSVADIERSANLLRHVAQSLTWVHPPSMSPTIRDTIRQFGEVAGAIFTGATEAWRSHDGLAANELARQDDEADLLQKFLLTELYTGQQTVEEAVSLALIARYYERIADHGVEMARQVAYFLTGERPDAA
jgi:phosphate transport system protein